MTMASDERRRALTPELTQPREVAFGPLMLRQEEAQALWDVLSHDSWQYDGPGMKVRAVLRRIAAYLEQETT